MEGLVAAGADITAVDITGRTPLHIAAMCLRKDACVWLFEVRVARQANHRNCPRLPSPLTRTLHPPRVLCVASLSIWTQHLLGLRHPWTSSA